MPIKEYKFIPRTDKKTVLIPGFLEGGFGKEVNAEVQGKYGKFNSISKINYNEKTGLVEGSNPFYVIAVNQVLRENGLKIRTATQADLEKILRTGEMQLKGFYEDTALVLRSRDNPNPYLAKHLADQVSLINSKIKKPYMIPLNELELQEDFSLEGGLSFKLRDDSEIIYAPILNENTGNFSSEDIDEKTGLPKKLGRGNRTLYTKESGLSRLCLYRNLDLNSFWYDLADSYSYGRVVVVSGEATSQKNKG